MKSIKYFTALYLILFLYACDDSGINPDVLCKKRWIVTGQTTTIAAVNGGTLNITSNGIPAQSVAATILSKDTLLGDFNITLNFSSFNAGSNLGTYMQLSATALGGSVNNSVRVTIGNITPAGNGPLQLGLVIDSLGTDTLGSAGVYTNISNTSGNFRVSRTGSIITLDATDGTSSINLPGNFYSLPLQYKITFGSNFQPINGTPSVKISDVTVTGTQNTGKTDDFGCNSLQ